MPKYFQHAIFVEILETGMILVELPLHRSFMQLNVPIGESTERGGNRYQAFSGFSQDGKRAQCIQAGGAGTRRFQEISTIKSVCHLTAPCIREIVYPAA
jgi:hypothetical protein